MTSPSCPSWPMAKPLAGRPAGRLPPPHTLQQQQQDSCSTLAWLGFQELGKGREEAGNRRGKEGENAGRSSSGPLCCQLPTTFPSQPVLGHQVAVGGDTGLSLQKHTKRGRGLINI